MMQSNAGKKGEENIKVINHGEKSLLCYETYRLNDVKGREMKVKIVKIVKI